MVLLHQFQIFMRAAGQTARSPDAEPQKDARSIRIPAGSAATFSWEFTWQLPGIHDFRFDSPAGWQCRSLRPRIQRPLSYFSRKESTGARTLSMHGLTAIIKRKSTCEIEHEAGNRLRHNSNHCGVRGSGQLPGGVIRCSGRSCPRVVPSPGRRQRPETRLWMGGLGGAGRTGLDGGPVAQAGAGRGRPGNAGSDLHPDRPHAAIAGRAVFGLAHQLAGAFQLAQRRSGPSRGDARSPGECQQQPAILDGGGLSASRLPRFGTLE